ncbi:MAG: glycosyltransferase [Endomicrobia bacterium]|nr:glycosyltransferase [Endomicrobiia bacterium]
MNIVFLCREYDRSIGYGGIGTYIHNISEELSRLGHKVFVVTSLPRKKSWIERKNDNLIIYYAKQLQIKGLGKIFLIFGMETIYLRLMCALTNYLVVKRLNKIFKIDIIETAEWFNEGLFCELFLKIPVVCKLNGGTYFCSKYDEVNIIQKIKQYLETILELATIKFATAVVSPTYTHMQEVNSKFGVKIDAVIPNCIKVGSTEINKEKDKKDVHTKKVLFVGRIEKRKNPDVIIRAIPKIVEKVKNVEFIFVGGKTKHYYKKILPLINELNVSQYIKFLGPLPPEKVNEFRKTVDVCVVPSLYEVLPLVVLEGILSRSTLVCSDIPVFREILENGKIGILVDPYDENIWAKNLIEILTNNENKKEFVLNAYEKLKQEYSVEKVSKDLAEFYLHVKNQYQKKSLQFHYALPNYLGRYKIPWNWKMFVLQKLLQQPALYHFYLLTAKQLLRIIDEDLNGKKILDLGSTPIISMLLAMLGAKVTLVDIDKEEIRKAYNLAKYFNVEDNTVITQQDLFKTNFIEKFDIVFNCGVIEHFYNSVEIIKIMKNNTVLGGKVICLVPYKYSLHSIFIRRYIRKKYGFYWDKIGNVPERSYSLKQLKKEFINAGLLVKKCEVGNIARNICDDHIISFLFHHFKFDFIRPYIISFFKILDFIEETFPFMKYFGFMAICCGIKNEDN